MSIVNTLSLESNRQIKINFDGGDLSSDAGLLLIKEFVSKLGIDKLFSHSFKTNDSASFRYHTDKENLLQILWMGLTRSPKITKSIMQQFMVNSCTKQVHGLTKNV